MTIILDIIYLPVLVQIMLAVVIGALYLLLGVPMIVWSLSVVGIMWLYSVDSVICWGIASVGDFFCANDSSICGVLANTKSGSTI